MREESSYLSLPTFINVQWALFLAKGNVFRYSPRRCSREKRLLLYFYTKSCHGGARGPFHVLTAIIDIRPQNLPHSETGVPELLTPETAECNEVRAYFLESERPGSNLPLPLPGCEHTRPPSSLLASMTLSVKLDEVVLNVEGTWFLFVCFSTCFTSP